MLEAPFSLYLTLLDGYPASEEYGQYYPVCTRMFNPLF